MSYPKPPGWYPDDAGARRYWTGTAWEQYEAVAPAVPPCPAPLPSLPGAPPVVEQPAFYLAKGGAVAYAPSLRLAVPKGGLHAVVPGALNTPSGLRRAMARLLDELLLLVLSLPVLVPMAQAAGRRAAENVRAPELTDAMGLLNGIGLADVIGFVDVGLVRVLHVALLLRVTYWLVGLLLLRGSAGKRLLRMRVIRGNGARSDGGRLLLPRPVDAAGLVLAEVLVLLVALHLLPMALLLLLVNWCAGAVDGQRRTLLERATSARTIVHKRLPRGERGQCAAFA